MRCCGGARTDGRDGRAREADTVVADRDRLSVDHNGGRLGGRSHMVCMPSNDRGRRADGEGHASHRFRSKGWHVSAGDGSMAQCHDGVGPHHLRWLQGIGESADRDCAAGGIGRNLYRAASNDNSRSGLSDGNGRCGVHRVCFWWSRRFADLRLC